MSIEYRTMSDEKGRCRFFLNWVTESGRKRSQVFFANPEIYGFSKPEDVSK